MKDRFGIDRDQMTNAERGDEQYALRHYEEALKFYEAGKEEGDPAAVEGLANIHYYGRTGNPDYAAAFQEYTVAADAGRVGAMVKLSDIYKNGTFVKRDPFRSEQILEEAYEAVRESDDIDAPKPEVCTRLARWRAEEGNREEALRLYREARDVLAERIARSPVFTDLNTMEWLSVEKGTLSRPEEPDLFDLFFLLGEDGLYEISRGDEVYTVASAGDQVVFEDQAYMSPGDFLRHARIGKTLLAQLWKELSVRKV